jgi:hypothetical protein
MRFIVSATIMLAISVLAMHTNALAKDEMEMQKSDSVKALEEYRLQKKQEVLEGRGLFKKGKRMTREEICWELYKACTNVCQVVFNINWLQGEQFGDGYGFSPSGGSNAEQYNRCTDNCRGNWMACKGN